MMRSLGWVGGKWEGRGGEGRGLEMGWDAQVGFL